MDATKILEQLLAGAGGQQNQGGGGGLGGLLGGLASSLGGGQNAAQNQAGAQQGQSGGLGGLLGGLASSLGGQQNQAGQAQQGGGGLGGLLGGLASSLGGQAGSAGGAASGGISDILGKLNGMFAFAFADTVEGEWLVARDTFGIKPLYFSRLAGEFIFASEIKALLCHPGIKAETNWRALQHYMTFQFCLNGQTLFANVEALEPGFYLKGRGAEVVERIRYWDTNYKIDYDHTEDYFNARVLELLDKSWEGQKAPF